MDLGAIFSLWEAQITLSENVCKYILNETLKGLAFMHERRIIHRDIKSDNILFSNTGELKIADFGTAVNLTRVLSKR